VPKRPGATPKCPHDQREPADDASQAIVRDAALFRRAASLGDGDRFALATKLRKNAPHPITLVPIQCLLKPDEPR
jgi:hypothetical protein